MVTEGSVICSYCDRILDASFLGGDITNEDDGPAIHDEATNPRAEAPPARPEPKTPAAWPAPSPKKPVLAPAVDDGYVDPAELNRRAGKRLDELAAPSADTTEAIEEFAHEFKVMAFSQKLTVIGAAGVLLSLALPWKGTREDGDLIGLLAGGWLAGLLAALVLAAMFMRRHPRLLEWKDRLLQGVAAAAALTGVTCIAFMKQALSYEVVRAAGQLLRESTSWPAFGVYVALVASMVMLGGALKSWIDRDVLPE